MNKCKFFLSIIVFIILSSCGYSRLNDQSNQIKFDNIEIIGDKRLSYILKNNLILISKQEANSIYDLSINLSNSKTSKIKDASGKTIRFNLILNGDLKLIDDRNFTYNRLFAVSNDFDVSTNHSDTIRNEKNALQNNINKLSEEIIKYIQLINIK